jgi:dolichyl-phosphate beta-glucosyltransferase
VRAILNLPLRDTQCGFKAFVREPLLPVVDRLRLDGFSFDVEFLFAAWRNGLAIQEVDFEVVERRPTRYAILMQSPRMLMDLLRIRLTAGRAPQKMKARNAESAPPDASEAPALARDLPHQN